MKSLYRKSEPLVFSSIQTIVGMLGLGTMRQSCQKKDVNKKNISNPQSGRPGNNNQETISSTNKFLTKLATKLTIYTTKARGWIPLYRKIVDD